MNSNIDLIRDVNKKVGVGRLSAKVRLKVRVKSLGFKVYGSWLGFSKQ